MRILLVSSEVHPYSKTGGLADMVGALCKSLARAGHQVGVVTPMYLGVREQLPQLKSFLPLDLPLGAQQVHGEIWTLEPEPGLTIYFVDQPGFYQRTALYQVHNVDYPDNAERFIYLSKAAAFLALQLEWKPEIVHAHDWQAAASILFIRHASKQLAASALPRTCITLHNLAYQGIFPANSYALTNLPWDYFNPEGVEFYGQMNCLKAGIAFADSITTVSPTYAREITTAELGFGLEGLLRQRQQLLTGILNGVDYDEWNTTQNPYLKRSYDVENLEGKLANKLDLQSELGLPVDGAVPLFGSVGRLVEQKGVDILLGAMEEMLNANLQFVLLGTGSPQFERSFADLGRRFPSKAAIRIQFEQALSHRIEAGCDFFLMPSKFEPCGLNQMYSLEYGTIPIVRKIGGLDDSVVDVREDREKADGIKFSEYSASALSKAIRKALALYVEPEALSLFRRNGMNADFSWNRTMAEYLAVYRKALSRV
jgi:starch synthase